VDSESRRLYVPSGQAVLVFDLDTFKPVGAVTNTRAHTVAVDATIFGRMRWPSNTRVVRRSIAASYSPATVPSGPEIRCSSSWIIRSGGSSDHAVSRADSSSIWA